MMTTCPSCGSPVAAEDRFCGRCGTALGAEPQAEAEAPRFCTNCGGPVEPEDHFCGRCGTPVRFAGQEPEDQAPTGVADEPVAVVVEEPELVQDDREFSADWNAVFAEPPPPPQAAVTEAIERPGEEPDTVVLPELAEKAPEPAPASAPAPGTLPTPAPAPAPPPPSPAPTLWGAAVALVGAVAVIASAAVPWSTQDPGMPRDIAARFLLDPEGPISGLNLGVVLLVAGALGAVAAMVTMFAPRLGIIRRLVGLATLALPVLYVIRAWGPGLPDVLRIIGPGVYVAAVGAVVQLVAGRRFRG